MNKKLTTALICGTIVTSGASLFAETGLNQHEDVSKTNKSTQSKSIDYPVRDRVEIDHDKNSKSSVDTRSFDWQARKRLESWDNIIGLNRARYERSGRKDATAEKTMDEMDTHLDHWRMNQDKFAESSDMDKEKVASEISRLDQEMVKKQKEFDQQVPRDSVDYKNELKSTISQIEAAEKDIDNQLSFLNQREKILKDIQGNLDEIKEEASEHLAEIEEMNDTSEWAELKSEIDSWMNENLNLDG